MNSDWPAYQKVTLVGPWDGPIGAVVPEDGLPGTAKQVLALAQEGGWGFGPISLVLRMNHPSGIPPFYASWLFDPDTKRWHFDGARDHTGFELTYPAIRKMLPLANEVADGPE